MKNQCLPSDRKPNSNPKQQTPNKVHVHIPNGWKHDNYEKQVNAPVLKQNENLPHGWKPSSQKTQMNVPASNDAKQNENLHHGWKISANRKSQSHHDDNQMYDPEEILRRNIQDRKQHPILKQPSQPRPPVIISRIPSPPADLSAPQYYPEYSLPVFNRYTVLGN